MLKALLSLICLIGIIPTAIAADEKADTSGYVGSDQCGACHSDVYNAWKSSRHAGDFNRENEENKPSEPGQAWIDNCSGCHTTGMDARESGWKERGVGCEACHGPGKDHASTADAGKIVSSVSADICGRCHSGNVSGSGLMPDGTRWIVGFRPGMKLSDIPGLQLTLVNPEELPPPPVNNHPLIYNMWKASGHNIQTGQNFTIGGKEWSGTISCVACHSPHRSDNAHQLVTAPENLCGSCHSQNAVLKGKGAEGVEQTRSLHTQISCIACHMTERNHLMRVLRPDNPDLSENRTDSCSSCHEVKDRKVRAEQIQEWEAWYRKTLEPVQADMLVIDEAVKKNPDLFDAELKKKLEVTKSNLAIIEQDGSEGVHNLDYALEIMSLAKRNLSRIKEAIQ